MSNHFKYYSGLLLLFFFAGCSSPANKPVKQTIVADTTIANRINAAIQLAQTGDIAIRCGLGPDSYMLIQMNARDKRYSHCGVVVLENGYPFVYHSIGGEDNPDLRMRRDSLSTFFSKKYNSGFAIIRYQQDSALKQRVAKRTLAYYNSHPLFDMDFDLDTDDRLYCSELVYKVETSATDDMNYISTSVNGAKKYVGIDDLYLSSHGGIIWKVAF